MVSKKRRTNRMNVQRKQKTIEDFNRLPEEFTAEDVMKCLALGNFDAWSLVRLVAWSFENLKNED